MTQSHVHTQNPILNTPDIFTFSSNKTKLRETTIPINSNGKLPQASHKTPAKTAKNQAGWAELAAAASKQMGESHKNKGLTKRQRIGSH
jgi:hypothetical protein